MVVHISDAALDWLTISFLPGIGCATVCRLAERYLTPAAIIAAPDNDSDMHPRLARLLSDEKALAISRDRANAQLETLYQRRVSFASINDSIYPDQLRVLSDPPPFLFYQGELASLCKPAVALVGSRSVSSYGARISGMLAGGLASSSVVVVSGVALGVDGHAHRGAIKAGGLTAGVLGCGLDICYPRSHAGLYRHIIDNGVLLSEYPCGTRPDGFRFPARNRIISGLSMGVVVVEAALKSGSLITARLALDQGKEVFAVPGRIDSSRSVGTHLLIRQGAHLVQCVDDILIELDLLRPQGKPEQRQKEEVCNGAGETEQRVLSCLDVYPVDIDTIMRVSGLTGGRIFDVLLQLELQGLIRQMPGQMYEKVIIE
jgi:DNA processing protein